MRAIKTLIIWLTLAFACFLSASALTPTLPENRIWEIFSIGYDAAVTEATDLGNRTETPTSNYDSAPIYSTATEKYQQRRTALSLANRPNLRPQKSRALLGTMDGEPPMANLQAHWAMDAQELMPSKAFGMQSPKSRGGV